MEKRTILAFVLVAVMWIVWLLIFPQQQTQQPEPEKKTDEVRKEEKQNINKNIAAVTGIEQKQEERSIQLATDKYNFEFTNQGASLKRLTYKERNIDLVVPKSPFNTNGRLDFSLHFNEDEFLKGNRLDETNWAFAKGNDGSLRFATTILFNGNPIRVEKIYRFSGSSYFFNIEYRITNIGRTTISFQNNSVLVSPGDILGPSLDFHNTYNLLSSIYYCNNSFDRGSKGGLFSGNETIKRKAGNIGWFGIMSRYFLIIMIPEGFSGTSVVYDGRENSGFRTGMYLQINPLAPGANASRTFRVYVGEKNKERLAAINTTLIDAADISKWIEPIRYFVVWCLMQIDRYIGNLGWSLVIFSLLTKIVFTPLTLKSMESMKKMQKLTPKLNELKVKYKDKPEVMQREMMKMYKENKVNPLGGCLPLLLQMPFFFALYSALINSIDLWNAPFILWIRDLSMPDTIATVAGFNINILPIVMTGTSFLQQKLSTVETGPQQRMMMLMMPVVLLFIFWTMPSGLVLYWTLQNVFQIIHQMTINKFGKKDEK